MIIPLTRVDNQNEEMHDMHELCTKLSTWIVRNKFTLATKWKVAASPLKAF